MTMYTRMAAMLLTLVMLLGVALPTAQAQTSTFPQTVDYVGGVIERGWVDGAKMIRSATLDVAYVVCSDAFLTVGEESTWTIVAQGGAAPYTYSYMMYWQDFSNTSTTYEQAWDAVRTSAQTAWAPDREGRYFLYTFVYDAAGQYIAFQSPVYETAKASDYEDENTVAGKVTEIVSSEIRVGMSAYDKALALHDWLIYNANYDYTYTNYMPDGVLLDGSGVCQSYALAYQMLLKEAGVESLYVTGMAGGGAHAWNLVKMGGEWYHVDCTWDDPNQGGLENHDYFGLTDALMARDHQWNYEGENFVPECTTTRYTYAINAADIVYSDISELNALVAALPEGMRTITFYYIGEEADVSAAFEEWLNNVPASLFGDDLLSLGASWSPLSATIVIERSSDTMVISPRTLTLDVGESWTMSAQVYPETGTVTWESSDEDVVRVDENGQATGIRAGTATITATLEGTDKQSTCEVEVLESEEEILFIINPDGELVAYLGNAKRIRSMPEGFTVIGEGAFEGCTNLAGVCVADGVTTIEAGAFAGCTNLSAIALPDSVETIAEDAIPQSVRTAYVDAGSAGEAWAKHADVAVLPRTSQKDNRYALPVAMQSIEEEAFIDSDPTFVQIEEGCVRIGAKAFARCEALADVIIPGSVTEIAADAFEDSLLLVIHAPQGSAAQDYAAQQGFGWEAE